MISTDERTVEVRLNEWQAAYAEVLADRCGYGVQELVQRLVGECLAQSFNDNDPRIVKQKPFQ